MDEVPGLGEKAKAIGHASRQICRLKSDLTNNRAMLEALVNGINALILPRGWVGIDDDGGFHFTYVAKELAPDLNKVRSIKGPLGLSFDADFVWAWRPGSRTYECMKDRTGSNRGKLFHTEGATTESFVVP